MRNPAMLQSVRLEKGNRFSTKHIKIGILEFFGMCDINIQLSRIIPDVFESTDIEAYLVFDFCQWGFFIEQSKFVSKCKKTRVL